MIADIMGKVNLILVIFTERRNPYVFCLHRIKNAGRDRHTTAIFQ